VVVQHISEAHHQIDKAISEALVRHTTGHLWHSTQTVLLGMGPGSTAGYYARDSAHPWCVPRTTLPWTLACSLGCRHAHSHRAGRFLAAVSCP
jgi:hypothetical protein